MFALHSKATKITVTSEQDSIPGSLRFAIDHAQSGDTIIFSSELAGGKITLTKGALVINKALVIVGPGENNLRLSGNRQFAIFKITPNGNLNLSGVTITECSNKRFEGEPGGSIYNQGVLSARQILITKNEAGALFNLGTLTLLKSKIIDNYVVSDMYPGGSASLSNTGTATIDECTFDSNDGYNYFIGDGFGGIGNSGTMKITNSTISRNNGGIGNSGTLDLKNSTVSNNLRSGKGISGGGIVNDGILNMEYCTIAHNIASHQGGNSGSGIMNYDVLSVKGCIIAKNGPQWNYDVMKIYLEFNDGSYQNIYETLHLDVNNFPSATIIDLGYNFIGINDDQNFTATTNKMGNRFFPLDPLIGPFKNNGGSTETHALLEGSPCINGGLNSGAVTFDQRGVQRTRPDIGAYEFINLPAISITNPLNGATFTTQSDILIKAEFIEEAPLLIINNTSGYKKLKIGFDSTGLYQGSRNVLAGGNTKLEITLKDFNGNTEWNKLQIRPNGNGINQIPLSKYIPIGGIGNEFTTITIPLSDFKGIDFTKLTLLELPYSNNAKPYKIGIKKIEFTGGATPFLWFGGSQINNNFTGTGTGGDLYAYILPATSPEYISKVEFYKGTDKLGEDYTAPYSITWADAEEGEYNLTAIAFSDFGDTISSIPVQIKVEEQYYVTNSRSGILNSSGFSFYPNPVSGKITLSSEYNNAEILITDMNGTISHQGNYEHIDGREIDLSSLSPGVYFLKIEDQKKQINKVMKLVKI
ncbi:cadherin domain-containing protein [Sporocytophaga myxococcoides]|uniref:Cadherin domain-containing protein n=2 Tax=Sporocytophaga myxococcoides TaxID=153721 RepID=A0A098LKI3_9BACT|nr:cadherin domain-containing protein [Sporocytophaga myxococcoides]